MSNKALVQPAFNSFINSWNLPLNANFQNIDDAFGTEQGFSLTSASGTIAVSATSFSGAYPANTPSYVPSIWGLSGTLTANVNLQIPAGIGGQWIVSNGTTGAFTVTISSAGGGASLTALQGVITAFLCDGSNVLLSGGGNFLPSGGGTISGTLDVDGVTTLHDNASLLGTLTVAGLVTLDDNASLLGTLDVSGATTLHSNSVLLGTLQVSGATVLNSNVGILGQLGVVGLVTFDDDASLLGNLTVNGVAAKPGGGPWAVSSDARIKTVEGDYKSGLEEIAKLNPVVYRYKGNDAPAKNAASAHAKVAADQTPFVGLIAQEVEAVMPEMVKSGSGFIDDTAVEDLRTMDTTPLIFALVNAVKTLTVRIKELETKIT